jgi:hypothetical protein
VTVVRRTITELLLACLAVTGAVCSASRVTSTVDVAPVIDSEPPTTSVTYHAPWLVLTLLLVTLAAVLVVLAGARWRRERPRA